jgi:acetyl esterase/lipase
LNKLAFIAAALLLCGCEKIVSQPDTNIAMGAELRPAVANIVYADDHAEYDMAHLLDIYLPQDNAVRRPVVMMTRGSSWTREDGKEIYYKVDGKAIVWNDGLELIRRLNDRGYAVVTVSIRPSSEATYPAQIHDAKAAVRWVRANAATYSFDSDHIGYFGDSSAGWIALMTALTGDIAELEEGHGEALVSSRIQAVATFFAPTDFSQMDDWAVRKCDPDAEMAAPFACRYKADSTVSRLVGCAINECPEKVQAANPVHYISDDDPPVLLFHGQSDRRVPHHQSELLYQALNKACRDVEFISLPLAGHGGFMNRPDLITGATRRVTSSANCDVKPLEMYTPTWDTLIDFFDKHLRPETV